MHKGCVCRLGFLLSADGGLQLPGHRQRPDLVAREPPHRLPVPGVRPAALSPPSEAVEGMAGCHVPASRGTLAVRGSEG